MSTSIYDFRVFCLTYFCWILRYDLCDVFLSHKYLSYIQFRCKIDFSVRSLESKNV